MFTFRKIKIKSNITHWCLSSFHLFLTFHLKHLLWLQRNFAFRLSAKVCWQPTRQKKSKLPKREATPIAEPPFQALNTNPSPPLCICFLLQPAVSCPSRSFSIYLLRAALFSRSNTSAFAEDRDTFRRCQATEFDNKVGKRSN